MKGNLAPEEMEPLTMRYFLPDSLQLWAKRREGKVTLSDILQLRMLMHCLGGLAYLGFV